MNGRRIRIALCFAVIGAAAAAKRAVGVGTGGAVASDDLQATQIGTVVLRHSGNAVDAAVASVTPRGA